MKLAETMRKITNEMLEYQAQKEKERIEQIYSNLINEIEKIAKQGKASTILAHQGEDNDTLIKKLIRDGFQITFTKNNETFVKW